MVLEKLINAIADVLEIDADDIDENSKFVDDLGADSLDIMEVIMSLEEEFNIQISMDAASSIVTVGDAATEIEKAINQ